MHDLGFGLQMTIAGMGSVFALLIILMLLLQLIGRLDRKPAPALDAAVEAPAVDAAPSADPEPQPTVRINAAGLTDDQMSAIAIAVITHAEVRRKEAAPAMRVRQPGSQIHVSRWTAFGRGLQTQIHHQRRR